MIGFDLTEQQQELKALARRFSEQEIIPRAREYDEKEIFPCDICEKAFAAGLMNLGVPGELGGPGLGMLDSSLILEELNYGCAGIANFVGANELGTLPIAIAANRIGIVVERVMDDLELDEAVVPGQNPGVLVIVVQAFEFHRRHHLDD